MNDLFSQLENDATRPLAERLRPNSTNQFIGQNQVRNKLETLIKNLKEKNYLPNLILWGPPGTGKTTWARLLGEMANAEFLQVNAIDTGAKDIREIGLRAYRQRVEQQRRTVLFIDEIHRLNRSQQDVLLPFTEKGDIILIGATTENPSYELNSALLSRSQVLVFDRFTTEDLENIFERAGQNLGFAVKAAFSQDATQAIIEAADGDARKLLNIIETLNETFDLKDQNEPLEVEKLKEALASRTFRFDKKGESHYDTISAFIKSMRGSDPDAAIYYLARMIKGGEDPVFIARRLVILASEDVGNADPRALSLAIAGLQAVEAIGLPEAGINLAQVVTYLASAPKSNRSYAAYKKALDVVEQTGTPAIPLPIRNAQTKLMKDLGYGKGYAYAHDYDRGYQKQDYLPEEVRDQVFYTPSEHGFEKNISQYLKWLRGEPKE